MLREGVWVMKENGRGKHIKEERKETRKKKRKERREGKLTGKEETEN